MSISARPSFVLGSVSLAMIGLLAACSGSSSTKSAPVLQPETAPPRAKAAAVAAPGAGPVLLADSKPAGTVSKSRVISIRPNQAISAPKAARGLGVMTVNLQHRDNPEQLATVAGHLKSDPGGAPDFIFCQEVLFERDGVHGSTADELASYLGYHVRGTQRTSDREGIAILSKYPFSFYDSINLKSQTSRLLLGFRRVSTMAEVKVPGVGLVRLVNVHFTNWGWEKRVRGNQLQQTLEWAAERERKAPAAITFLAGDFNADPEDEEMELVKDRSVTGPLAFKDWNGTTPSKGPMGNPDRRIDYIFVSAKPNVALRSEEVKWKDGVPSKSGKFYLSDHLAVVHRYHLPGVTPAPAQAQAPAKAAPAPAAPRRLRGWPGPDAVITGIETQTGR